MRYIPSQFGLAAAGLLLFVSAALAVKIYTTPVRVSGTSPEQLRALAERLEQQDQHYHKDDGLDDFARAVFVFLVRGFLGRFALPRGNGPAQSAGSPALVPTRVPVPPLEPRVEARQLSP